MPAPFAYGTTVTVQRATPVVDRYGNSRPGTYTDHHTIAGCGIAPRTSDDLTDRGRLGVVVGLTMFAPYDADLLSSDRVVVGGETYETVGDPGQWRSPLTGWQPGLEIALRRVEG